MFERLTEPVHDVIAAAGGEASRLGACDVRPEHLLLGLLDCPGTVAHTALVACGVDAGATRMAIAGEGRPSPTPGELPFSSTARQALERSLGEAIGIGSLYIGPEHLLLALLSTDPAGIGRLIGTSGVTSETLKDVVRLLATNPGDANAETARALLGLAVNFGRLEVC